MPHAKHSSTHVYSSTHVDSSAVAVLVVVLVVLVVVWQLVDVPRWCCDMTQGGDMTLPGIATILDSCEWQLAEMLFCFVHLLWLMKLKLPPLPLLLLLLLPAPFPRSCPPWGPSGTPFMPSPLSFPQRRAAAASSCCRRSTLTCTAYR